jgi:hypothetical protein
MVKAFTDQHQTRDTTSLNNEGFLDTDTQKNESMASITAICIIFIFFLSLPRYSRSESFSHSR